jgi:hypothetical protein
VKERDGFDFSIFKNHDAVCTVIAAGGMSSYLIPQARWAAQRNSLSGLPQILSPISLCGYTIRVSPHPLTSSLPHQMSNNVNLVTTESIRTYPSFGLPSWYS